MQNNMPSVREMLEKLSTEQLDEMLDRELHTEPVDANAIRMILDVLKEREKDYPVELTPELEEAWEKFQRQITKPKIIRMPVWLLRAASIVLIIGLLFMVMPQEAQAETFFDRLARLTADIVEFFGPKDDDARLEKYEFTTDNPGLQQVYDAVVEMGVAEPVVPMWLGDECEFNWIETTETPRKKGLTASLTVDSKEILYQIDVYGTEISHQYYKDETEMNEVELYGTDFTIIRNEELWIVIWGKDNFECSISLDCYEDTLYRILKSIYKMEDK